MPVRRGRSRDLDVARSGAATQSAMDVLQLNVARPCLRLHVALACLFGVNVARTGVHAKVAMQPRGMNVPGTCAELRILADPVIGHVARAGVGFEIRIGWGLDFIIDADVVQVLMTIADTDDVSHLFDGRIGCDFANTLLCVASSTPPARLDTAIDMHLVAGSMGQMNVARAGGHPKPPPPAPRQVTLEVGL